MITLKQTFYVLLTGFMIIFIIFSWELLSAMSENDLGEPVTTYFDRLIPEFKKDSAVINDLFRRCYQAEQKYRKSILYKDQLIHIANESQYSYIRRKYGFASTNIGVLDDSTVVITLPKRSAICYSVTNPIKYDTINNSDQDTKLVYERCWLMHFNDH